MDQELFSSQAAEWIKNHTFTELVNANGVEVWRCQEPGSNNLAFDICVTRYGIAVFGDIGHLTFDVGADYGINFLRNHSIGSVHRKQAASCKAVDLDKASILSSVEEAIIELIDQHVPDALKPKWLEAGSDFDQLLAWLELMNAQNDDASLLYGELLDCIDRIQRFDDGTRDIVPAFDFLAESETLLGVHDTWEWSITKPTDDLWRKIFYVRHAANQIMALKEAALASEPSPA